ncbi:SPOR domain-containing protein [Halovulum sp. GXIMD14793]
MSISSKYPAVLRLSASAVFCAAILSACGENSGGGASRTETVNIPGGSLKIQEKDVEAPDVFQMRGKGLWDGRPSLGGIWIAVPDDVQPDRVRITNTANGKKVIGSLFERDVTLPGPPIMVSSDAAAALGLTAGSPQELQIVVMRREAVEVVTQRPVDEVLAEQGTGEEDAETLAETDGEATEAAPAGIETAALEASVLGAIKATETGEKPAAAAPTKPAATPPVETAAVAPAAPTAPSAVKNPYIQVATVSSPKAANDIVRKLQSGGVPAEARITSSGGKNRFRVVVGPVTSAEQQTAQLKKVRALGFKDAFPIK